jgi:hypothetical protein
MKSVGLLVILIALTTGYAQIPDTLWTKTYGGAEDDQAYAVMQTSDGGYIIVGSTCSFAIGSEDMWLLKTDANGDILWTETYGYPSPVSYWRGDDVQQTSDGGYIIALSSGAGGLMKTNSIGIVQWTTPLFHGHAGGFTSAVRQTPDGGYIAAGTVIEWSEAFAGLAKTDSLGNIIWNNEYCHSVEDALAYSVLETADGGYVVTGQCCGRFYYFKTDFMGGTLWFNVFGIGCANSIQQTSGGGFILTGYSGDEGNGEADLCIAKCDSAGNSLGIWEYGGLGNDVGNSMDIIVDDDIIVAGYTESFGAGNSDVYLLRIEGGIYVDTIWTETYGGAADDVGNSVQRTADGGYIIAGYTESFGAGGRDIYLIKTAPETGIEERSTVKSVDKERVITTTIFRGPLQLPEDKKCKVFDITGRVVEPSKIQPGIYFIEIDGVVTQKVVKVR